MNSYPGRRRPASVLILSLMLTVPTLALQGTVQNAETGAAIVDAYVSSGGNSTTSAADGGFDLPVAPGDSLTVSHLGFAERTVVAGDRPTIVRLVPVALIVEEVVVAGLRKSALKDAAASVSVIGRRRLQAPENHHFQDLAAGIANLNWAGGTSRPRYFQIRGVGERSQFAGEGAPNYSVGFLMDDVDLSGLGSAGILFDLQQLEVYKGPQSTVFGPNSMAGQINVQSADPGPDFGESVQLTVGSDQLQRVSGVVNVPIAANLAMRLGVQSFTSNGFRDNKFLDRDDTNLRRENFLRAKMIYRWKRDLLLKGTVFFADLDNGYDAWTPDNNEDLITFSDNPGRDRQETAGGSLRGELKVPALDAELVSITSYAKTDQIYSFDGDWGNDDFWLQEQYGWDPAEKGESYDFFDETDRERVSFTQELRLLKNNLAGGSGALGVYYKDMEESDRAKGYLFGGEASALNGTFDLGDFALYGQYSRDLNTKLSLTVNSRADRHDTAYRGITSAAPDPVVIDNDQWLVGGKGALVYRAGTTRTIYGSGSRGYRPGGINQHPYLAASNRPFGPEYMTSLEIGLYAAEERSTTTVTAFRAWRSQQHVSLSQQLDPGDPNSFFYFTANASGTSSGLELEHSHRPLANLRLQAGLGILNTHVDAYTFLTETEEFTFGDRQAAHAPTYNLRVSGEYDHRSGLSGRFEVTAMDGFFYSDSHDQQSDAYQLVGGSLSYGWSDWKVTLWGRNLLDERYGVRGFFFGLEPPDYDPTLYESYGDPRQFGISLATTM